MRAKQKVLHTMSRKGYARLEEDMKNQSQGLDSISRVDVWIKGYTRQKGKPVNEVLQKAMNKVQELHKLSTEEKSMSIKNDAIVQVFGPERCGSVRGLGFGALPSKVDAQEPSKRANGHSHGETYGEENGRGERRVHGGGERRMRSQQNIWSDENNEDDEDIWLHDANEIGNGGSLDNAKCKLLNWDGIKVVVAEGTIASTDSKALVYHVPFGPRCWKVWVNHVIVNVSLFCPNREMFVLEDAIGSIVAWPTHFISFDFE